MSSLLEAVMLAPKHALLLLVPELEPLWSHPRFRISASARATQVSGELERVQ